MQGLSMHVGTEGVEGMSPKQTGGKADSMWECALSVTEHTRPLACKVRSTIHLRRACPTRAAQTLPHHTRWRWTLTRQ